MSGNPGQASAQEEERIPAGICPECGIVAGNCVNWRFPEPATCTRCENELEEAAMATGEEIVEADRKVHLEGSA